MASTTQGITLIGVGNMGLALATALLKADHSVTVWNRTTTRPQVKTAIENGAVLEKNLAKAISKNDIIIVCLLDYDTIKATFNSLPSSNLKTTFSGKTLINLTNGTLKQARGMQTFALETAGVEKYFDGAIMVTPQVVGGPHSFLVISGGEEIDSVKDFLSPIGRVQYLSEDITAASRFDLAALASMYGMFSGAFLGMGLLKRAGSGGAAAENANIGRVVKEEIVPFLTALVPYLGLIAESWDEEKWEENMGNPVGMQLQGVRSIIASCREEGIEDAGMLDGLAGLMERVVERYGSDAGVAGIGEFLLERRRR